MQTQVAEVQAVEADRLHLVLSGAKPMARAIGTNERTIRRWFDAGLLDEFVWKGPYPNSPLKVKRADLPRLRDMARRVA